MRPILPSPFPVASPKAVRALPGSKSTSLPGSSGGASAGSVAGGFAHLLRDPAGEGGGKGPGHRQAPLLHPPEPGGRPTRRHTPDDALDPSARHAAQLAPPVLPPASPAAPASPAQLEARVRSSLEDLLPALVRRVAWSGDGRRGTVRLELGAGELAGGTLLVQVDEGRVRVRLTAPPGVDCGAWRERIADRLAARGLAVDAVESD